MMCTEALCADDVVYGEASSDERGDVLKKHKGANVWIRTGFGIKPTEPPAKSPTGLLEWKVWWKFLVRGGWTWNIKFNVLENGKVKVGKESFWLQASNEMQFPSSL